MMGRGTAMRSCVSIIIIMRTGIMIKSGSDVPGRPGASGANPDSRVEAQRAERPWEEIPIAQ